MIRKKMEKLKEIEKEEEYLKLALSYKQQIRSELDELVKKIGEELREESRIKKIKGYNQSKKTAERLANILEEYASKTPLSSGELAALGRKLREWIEIGGA